MPTMKVLYHHLLETITVFGWLVSPLAPGMPGGPKSPFWPLRPASPLGPTCPIMPLSPFAPGMPAGPGFPFCPFSPASPFAPTDPLFSWWSYKASVSFLPFSSPVPFLPPRPWRTGRAWGTSQTLITCWLEERIWEFLSLRRLLVYLCWYSVADPGEGPVGSPPLFLDQT